MKTRKSISKSKIQLDQASSMFFPDYEYIHNQLGHRVEISLKNRHLSYTFSSLLAQLFLHETPNYEMSNGIHGASRSSWTYHTALAIAQTSKILNLTCRFEAMGRRDAIIQMRGSNSEVVLAAEWEWDYKDIFGKDKELDKLKKSCKSHKKADALLLTYCPVEQYADYLHIIADDWIESTHLQKAPPILFLHTVTYVEKKVGNSIG